jgi:Protein of unknown function, DUF481
MSKPKCLLIPVFLLCTCASYATTPEGHDTVSFKNGDTLTGNVLRATSATLTFSNKAVGELTLKWTDLNAIAVHHPMRVVGVQASPQDFDSATFTVATTSSGTTLNLEIKATGQDNAIAIQDVQSISGPNRCASGIQSACPGWTLQKLAVSTSFVTSTQHQQTYGANIIFGRMWHPDDDGWPHQRTRIELVPNYDEKRKNNKPGSAVITQDYFGRFQQLIFLNSDRFYVPVTADLFRNNSLGVYFQQSYGAGLGTQWNGLELDADLRFIGEHFYRVSPSLQLVGSELQEQYTFTLKCIGVVVNETGDFTPVFNASRAWQGKGLVELLKPIIPNKLFFSATFTDDYIENAPPTFRKNYIKTTVGLTFTPGAKH